MIQCTVSNYLISETRRLIPVERIAGFPAAPPVCSTVSFKYESLLFEFVEFKDESSPVLTTVKEPIDELDIEIYAKVLVGNGSSQKSDITRSSFVLKK